MYIGYAAFMLCRNTLISCSVEIIQDPALGMNKESFGHLMSWHSAGAILGKLITGPGADLLGGRRMFLLAPLIDGDRQRWFCLQLVLFSFRGV